MTGIATAWINHLCNSLLLHQLKVALIQVLLLMEVVRCTETGVGPASAAVVVFYSWSWLSCFLETCNTCNLAQLVEHPRLAA